MRPILSIIELFQIHRKYRNYRTITKPDKERKMVIEKDFFIHEIEFDDSVASTQEEEYGDWTAVKR